VRSSCPSAAREGGARSARTSHGPSAHISFSKRRNTPRERCLQWWALRGSNPRPPPCKGACGARERPGQRVESCSDQRRRLSLVVVVLQRFSVLHGLGTDLTRAIRRMRLHSNRPRSETGPSAGPGGCLVRAAAAAGVRPWRDERRRSRERVRTSSNAAVIALQGRSDPLAGLRTSCSRRFGAGRVGVDLRGETTSATCRVSSRDEIKSGSVT